MYYQINYTPLHYSSISYLSSYNSIYIVSSTLAATHIPSRSSIPCYHDLWDTRAPGGLSTSRHISMMGMFTINCTKFFWRW